MLGEWCLLLLSWDWAFALFFYLDKEERAGLDYLFSGLTELFKEEFDFLWLGTTTSELKPNYLQSSYRSRFYWGASQPVEV